MKEITISFNLSGGKNLFVTKDGSEIYARINFATFSADSEHFEGKTTPTDFDVSISKDLTGSGHSFFDSLVRYPAVISLLESLPKEKKQKEEKTLSHAIFTIDMSDFLTGRKEITKHLSATSKELPALTVDLDVTIKIDTTLAEDFLQKSHRIMSIRLLHAAAIPDFWVGNNFSASLPIPKANGETIAVSFNGRSEAISCEDSPRLLWANSNPSSENPDRLSCCDGFKIENKENQNGENLTLVDDGNGITFNMERRILMTEEDCLEFENRIARFTPLLPLEISRSKDNESNKKGKAKADDQELQNHGLSLINLSPLLYPGVKSIKGTFSLNGFTESAIMKAGYVSSVAAEVNRTGSSLNLEQRLKSASRTQSSVSDVEHRGSVNSDSIPYNEYSTSVYFELILSRPLIERVSLSDINRDLSEIIPSRPAIPRKKFGADAAVDEYRTQIALIARQILSDIREYRTTEISTQSFTDSMMYQMNKNGKYSEYHDQLKYAVIRVVREKYLKTTNFTSDAELKTFLEILYVFLIEEMHGSLNETVIQNAPPKPEPIASLEELRYAAEFAEKMDNLDEAETLWSELLARDEANSTHWEGLARTCLTRGDAEKAYEALRQAISLDHSAIWTMILASVLAKERGNVDQAKILLARAAANPDSEDQTVKETAPTNATERAIAYILISNLHTDELEDQLAKFSTLESERLSKKIETNLPGNVIFLIAAERFAKSAIRGVAQKMLAQYIASLGQEPIPGQALLLKSKLEMWSGEFEAALETITSATKMDHKNPTIWAQMGHIYLKMENFCEAKEALLRTVAYKDEPDDPVIVYVRLAQLLADEEKWESARAHYLLACEKCPTATSWLGVGISSLRMGKLQEAEDALAEANLLDPKNPTVWAYLSLLCLQTDRKLEAEQSYKFATKLNLQNDPLINEIKVFQQKVGFGDPSY